MITKYKFLASNSVRLMNLQRLTYQRSRLPVLNYNLVRFSTSASHLGP